MRKFTLLIVAVLMAITASAQKLDSKLLVRPVSPKGNMVARALPENAKPVKPFKLNKKARKAASIKSIDDLTGKWMQIYYSYFDEVILSTMVEITKTGENSITINGWWASVAEPIEATVDLAAGTVTVAPQLIYDSGVSAELVNADTETEGAPLVGTIAKDGSISFEEGWAVMGSDGAYEYATYTSFVRPNGEMEFLNDGVQIVDVYIEQDEEEEKVYVYNFGDFGRTIELGMNSDKTIEVPSSQIVYTGTNGDFYLYGLDETAENLISLSATGTEKTITFDQDWTGYTSTQYWLGQNTGTTITLTDGSKFVYPAEIADVVATPANPTDLEYNVHETYGPRILVDVPRVDKDGNKLRKDKLFYQIYYIVGGDVFDYTLKASDYKYLDSDMDLIPYNFTDDYDIYTDGDSKQVYLYGSDGWEKVGVKSIYLGGDETHESEIVWYDIVAAGISTVNANEQNGGKAYNMAGQLVKQGYKGIVVKNGKKFLMK
ncbi:MAG: hypothetical protein J6M37_03755 [Prevotella sp.]|nr:hypothetical protein [Prevotella sp.]